MTIESWLAAHPYLEPMANFHAQIESALARFSAAEVALPDWDAYATDFHAGIPLLKSSNINIELSRAEKLLNCIVDQLIVSRGKVGEECRLLQSELHRHSDSSLRAIASLLEESDFDSSSPGLLCYLGWTALSRHRVITHHRGQKNGTERSTPIPRR